MPLHDWTRVSAGTFHDFHCCSISEIRNRLNMGILPGEYYAQIEQSGSALIADNTIKIDTYAARARRVVIRHSSGDLILALIEIVSPDNKAAKNPFRTFIEKAATALAKGYHLMLIDLFPPGSRDPQGIHGALWAELGNDTYIQPPDKPLTLASYSAGLTKTAYVEPLAVGDALTPMPLFLTSSYYVNVPLEECYQAAYRGVPRRWREVLEGAGGGARE